MSGFASLGEISLGGLPWLIGSSDGFSEGLMAASIIAENQIWVSFTGGVSKVDPFDPNDALNPENYALLRADNEETMSVAAVTPLTFDIGNPLATQSSVVLWTDKTIPEGVDLDIRVTGSVERTATGTTPFTMLEKTAKGYESGEKRTSRKGDIANALTNDMRDASASTTRLGGRQIDARGGFANQSPRLTLKKRMFRRLITNPGDFTHAPSYGVGVEAFKAQSASDALYLTLTKRIEAQMLQEPEVEKVSASFKRNGHVLQISVKATENSGATTTVSESFDWFN